MSSCSSFCKSNPSSPKRADHDVGADPRLRVRRRRDRPVCGTRDRTIRSPRSGAGPPPPIGADRSPPTPTASPRRVVPGRPRPRSGLESGSESGPGSGEREARGGTGVATGGHYTGVGEDRRVAASAEVRGTPNPPSAPRRRRRRRPAIPRGPATRARGPAEEMQGGLGRPGDGPHSFHDFGLKFAGPAQVAPHPEKPGPGGLPLDQRALRPHEDRAVGEVRNGRPGFLEVLLRLCSASRRAPIGSGPTPPACGPAKNQPESGRITPEAQALVRQAKRLHRVARPAGASGLVLQGGGHRRIHLAQAPGGVGGLAHSQRDSTNRPVTRSSSLIRRQQLKIRVSSRRSWATARKSSSVDNAPSQFQGFQAPIHLVVEIAVRLGAWPPCAGRRRRTASSPPPIAPCSPSSRDAGGPSSVRRFPHPVPVGFPVNPAARRVRTAGADQADRREGGSWPLPVLHHRRPLERRARHHHDRGAPADRTQGQVVGAGLRVEEIAGPERAPFALPVPPVSTYISSAPRWSCSGYTTPGPISTSSIA